MCRNIRVLHHFEPPSTPEEIRAAAEQFVRKVSGVKKPAKADVAEIERAVDAVMRATTRLLDNLPERGAARTREGERERARARWTSRAARIVDQATRPASEPAAAKRRGAARAKPTREAAASRGKARRERSDASAPRERETKAGPSRR